MALSVPCTGLARNPMWPGKFLLFPPVLGTHFIAAWGSVSPWMRVPPSLVTGTQDLREAKSGDLAHSLLHRHPCPLRGLATRAWGPPMVARPGSPVMTQ